MEPREHETSTTPLPKRSKSKPNRRRPRSRSKESGRDPAPIPEPSPSTLADENHPDDSENGALVSLAAAVVGGVVLARAVTARRGRYVGLGAVLAGFPFVYRGLTGKWPIARSIVERANLPLTIEASTTVERSADDLYTFWRRLENLPRFMKDLDEVTQDGNRSHWKAHTKMGVESEWDAEIVEDQPGRLLSWRSLPGAAVETSGSVLFESMGRQGGTVVRVTMQISPAGDGLRRAVGKAFLFGAGEQVRQEIRRFKSLMETGEVPTTDGQSAGERSLLGRRNLLARF